MSTSNRRNVRKTLVLCALAATAMANLISPASAAVIGNVKVSGNVQDRATFGTSAPSNQAVFKYLWQAGWNACRSNFPGTRSMALTRVVAPVASQTGNWQNVTAFWACRDTP
ncbi:hypothetical protein [Xanthomonas vasicola]|uniref:hypothetical protein n=2 Tax=Xanthomonas vasicola TaxID=56459 RepID=UPI0021BD8CCA|nr:hypothetical protein [Xanthomonas vasicola]